MEKKGLEKWIEESGKEKRTIVTLLKIPLDKISKILSKKGGSSDGS